METVYIYPLATLRKGSVRRLYQAQQEAARVWIVCRDRHLAARTAYTRWPTRDDLQQATKGQFALHSQTVQMVCHQFLANVDTARQLRQTNRQMRYPYKDKRFFPLYWPAEALECGARPDRLADGAWAPVPGVQAGPARADWRLQAGLEGRL